MATPIMPRKPINWKSYNWKPYAQHHDTGGSDAAYARSIGVDPRQFNVQKQKYYRPEHTSVTPAIAPTVYPEHTAIAPVSPVVTPQSIPDIARQSTVDALTQRVEVLEAFIATFQQRGIPVSPNGTPHLTDGIPRLTVGTPTTKHSFVIAVEQLDALQRYAAAHQAQVKDALYYLVGIGLATVAAEVDADA